MGAARPFWLTAFLDFPAAEYDAGVRFWTHATGFDASAPRGENSEFATLLPASGDDYLRVQRLGDGVTRLHLDLHVVDPWAAAEAAEDLGAELVDDSRHSYVVLRSPGGIVLCFVTQPAATVPPAAVWPAGQTSRLAQVCWDVPRARFSAQAAFWQAILAGEWTPPDAGEAITRKAGELALDLRLQPAEIAREVVGHLHQVTDDRSAEVARLTAAGSITRSVRETQTMLETPGGVPLCVLDQQRGGIACRA